MKKITYFLVLITSLVTVNTFGQVTTYPYTQDFEAFGQCPTGCGPVCPLAEDWGNPAAGQLDWTSDIEGTGSGSTGPTANGGADHTTGAAGGTYLYVETSCNGTGYPNITALLDSPVFDLTSLPRAELKFWYHMFGTTMGNLSVEVTTDGGVTYTEVLAPFTDNQDVWQEGIIDLNAYITETALQIRFRYISGSSFTGDIALDDITVQEPPIPAVFTDCPTDVSLALQNGNTGVNYSFTTPTATDPEGGSVTVTQTDGLPSGSSFPAGTNRIEFTATNDASPFEVTICEYFVYVTLQTLLYEESFESGAVGWVSSGTNNSWQLGTPAGSVIMGASDGTQAWMTNLTGDYNSNENSMVASPLFDFSLSANDPSINIDVWWNTETSWDGAVLQTTIDNGATWQNVGANGDPDNWYTDNTINSAPGGQQEGWSGSGVNSSGGWVTATHILDNIGGEDNVSFRVAFGSDGSVTDDGFAFDNIVIYYPGDPTFDDCPMDMTEALVPGECDKIVIFDTPTATDSEAEKPGTVTVTQTQGPASGSAFPPGTTLIEFTAVNDNSPNETAICQFNVIVTGTPTPVITCPNTMNEVVDTSCMFAIPDYTDQAIVGGFCTTTPTVTQSPVAGTMVGVGTTEITLTATDGTQSTDCMFDLIVTDNVAPSAVCQDITVQLDATGSVVITAADVDGGSTDNCGIASIAINNDTFDCTNVGANLVTLTVTDVNGNSATCEATVTVQDSVVPAIVCQDITVQLDATGSVVITAADVDGGSTDNCGVASIAINNDTFDCTNVGANLVTLTVTDVNGNSATCEATVTVQNNETATVLSGPVDIFTGTGTSDGSCNTIVNYDPVTPSSFELEGNCDTTTTVTVTQTGGLGSGAMFPVGTTIEEYTITDANGNDTVYTFEINIADTTLPTIDCPEDVLTSSEENSNYTILDYTDRATDNCSTATALVVTQSPEAGTTVAEGSITTVNLTATDAAGNTTQCSFKVTVDSALSIDDVTTPSSITLYPNPTNGMITLSTTSTTIRTATVFDMRGRVVKNLTFDQAQSQQIDLSQAQDGVYLIHILTDNGTTVKQVIKKN